jgi:regulator of vacuolar morphogenesis
LQREELGTQDEQLEQLMSVLKRQGQIGQAIGDELDLQNKLLEELDADVDRTQAKLKKTGKTLVKVSANA